MNEILKIIETRNLYVHLILFKIYLGTKGRTNSIYDGDLRAELKDLFEEKFSNEDYQVAVQYLRSEDLLSTSQSLSILGRSYFENWIMEFQYLNQADKDLLEKEVPKRVFDYFGMAEKAVTIMDFVSTLFNLVNRN